MLLLVVCFCVTKEKFNSNKTYATLTNTDSIYPSAESDDTSLYYKFDIGLDIINILHDLNYPIKDKYYCVNECWDGTNKHSMLWKARFNLISVTGDIKDEWLVKLQKTRSPVYLARLMNHSSVTIVENLQSFPDTLEMYQLLIDTLLTYNKRIRSVDNWRSRFDKLLAGQRDRLNSNTAFHKAGFPASRDSCMLKSSNRECSLESWCYGFWIRRYQEQMFDLSEMILRWTLNLLNRNLTANDSIDFGIYLVGDNPEEAYEKQMIDKRNNDLAELKKKYSIADSFAWDGPIFSGYSPFNGNDGSIIINQECRIGDDYAVLHQWVDATFFRKSYGLEEGMIMTAIDPNGTLKNVKLNELNCKSGECHGSWWLAGFREIELGKSLICDKENLTNGNNGNDNKCSNEWFAAFPVSVIAPDDKIYKIKEIKDDTGCDIANSNIIVPPDSSITKCKHFITDKKLAISMHLFRYEKEDELGNPGGPNFIQIKNGNCYGRWIKLSTIGNGFYPYFIIIHNSTTYVLFASSEGIRGPAAETRMLARLEGSNLLFGRAFSAGGQPCD